MAWLSANFLKDYVARLSGKGAFRVGTVAFTVVVFSQYWRVDQHIVFFLILTSVASNFVGLPSSSVLSSHSSGSLFFFFGFLSWIVLSVIWSPTPHLTLSYAVLVLLAGTTAVAQGFIYGFRVLIAGISIGVAIIVLHILFLDILSGAVKFPFSGFGLYTNASSLSFVLGIGIIGSLFTLSRNPLTWAFAACTGIIASTWLWGLSILTAVFALLGAFFTWLALFSLRLCPLRWKRVLASGYGLLFTLGGLFFWFLREPLLRPLGEDGSLGERLPLWGAYFEAVLWKPWLGSGWGSTVGWDFPLSRGRLAPVYEWFPAHNGFLDIALMLGFVGLFLFLAALLGLLIDSLRLATSESLSWRTAFFPVLLSYLILTDLMSTNFPKLIGVFLVGSMIGAIARIRGDLSPPAGADSIREREAQTRRSGRISPNINLP